MANPSDAIEAYRASLQDTIRDAFKSLLESKHLYQSVTYESPDHKPLIEAVVHDFRSVAVRGIAGLNASEWWIVDPASGRIYSDEFVNIVVPDVKLHCTRCDRTEAFNLVSVEDFLRRERSKRAAVGDTPVLLLVISFLCQSCKSIPELFLVRMQAHRLTLSGRSPMESVPIPTAIPKPLRRSFTNAIVAHQSGQTLAANFLLRVLIELWARSQVEGTYERADELMDAYMKTLPDDFSKRFPSMRDLYGRLSADMHAAVGSADLFEASVPEVVEHFDARKLFKLPELPPQV